MSPETPNTYFGRSEAVTHGDLNPTEQVLCPLCGISPNPFAVDFQGFSLCRCKNCGLEFVTPRLSFEELSDKVYSDNYFPNLDGSECLSAEMTYQFGRQLARFEDLIPGRRTLLDIGCGTGEFLGFANTAGWQVAGCDIKLWPNARALDCPMWEGKLDDIDFGSSRFDLIRLNQVLEHSQNPVEVLTLCRSLLTPNGVLYISVPNISSLSARLKSLQSAFHLKSHRWRHYAAMHHLFFFSPKTLLNIIERSGFRVINWSTPVPKKTGQSTFVEAFYRTTLERTRTYSVMDFYCTPN